MGQREDGAPQAGVLEKGLDLSLFLSSGSCRVNVSLFGKLRIGWINSIQLSACMLTRGALVSQSHLDLIAELGIGYIYASAIKYWDSKGCHRSMVLRTARGLYSHQ